MATLKTEGARYLKAVWPFGLAWLGTFQLVCQTLGSMRSTRPAWAISCLQIAREMGERALTGTKTLALDGSHWARSWASPPRDKVVDVGMVLELPAPGVQDTRKTREVGANETRVFGEAFDGLRGRFEQGRIGEWLMRADKGA